MSHTFHLNIGGQVYCTDDSTINRFPTSLLARKLDLYRRGQLETAAKDPQGNLFFDRDGVVFRHILNYLRTGKLLLPERFEDFELLIEEAQFYRLPQLEQAVRIKKVMKRNGNDYVMVEKEVTDCPGQHHPLSMYKMYGLQNVLKPLTAKLPDVLEPCKIFGTGICHEPRFPDDPDADITYETKAEFGAGCPWSRIVAVLTRNGFTCKSVACGGGGGTDNQGMHATKMWLFERKNCQL